MNVFRDAEKALGKGQHPLGFKENFRKLEIERYFLKLIQDMYKNSSINIMCVLCCSVVSDSL